LRSIIWTGWRRERRKSCDDLEYYSPEFGTIVFCKLRSGSVDKLYRLLMEKYETCVAPGRFFDMPDGFRMGIGGDPEMTREGLARLGLALDEMRHKA
jgi:aspartate/methionine/tyrosine aminotransferase